MDVSVAFVAIALVFLTLTAWDWQRTSRELDTKKKIWLTMAAIFLAVSIILNAFG